MLNVFVEKQRFGCQTSFERAHEYDGGIDLASFSEVLIPPEETALIATGFKVEVPVGYVAMIVSRSGMSLKGLIVKNSPGIIDPSYRGDIKVILWNTNSYPVVIKPGDRIAQMLFVPVEYPNFIFVDKLSDTERGEGGFGSTGV